MTDIAPLFSSVIGKNTVSIILGSHFKSIPIDTERGQKLLAALRKQPQDYDEIAMLADIQAYIVKHTFGRVTLDDKDVLRLDGRVVDYGLTSIIVRFINEGYNVKPLVMFLENVDKNPDANVAPTLYKFVSDGSMPITPDGCFHAFKRVNANYESFAKGCEDVTVTRIVNGAAMQEVFNGHIPHPLGAVLEMDRAICDPNRNATCSIGLHACSFNYLEQYHGGNGRVLIVKINPMDVTAIPNDHNDTKLRCCKLEVVAEIAEAEANAHFNSVVDTRYEPEPEIAEPEDEDEVENDEAEDDSVDADVPVSGPILAIAYGYSDGCEQAQIDGEFDCDPLNGQRAESISGAMSCAYAVAFCKGYLRYYELHPFHSEKALEAGEDDGAADGKRDDDFDPAPQNGERFDEMSEDHEETYSFGYMRGYLRGYTGENADS